MGGQVTYRGGVRKRERPFSFGRQPEDRVVYTKGSHAIRSGRGEFVSGTKPGS